MSQTGCFNSTYPPPPSHDTVGERAHTHGDQCRAVRGGDVPAARPHLPRQGPPGDSGHLDRLGAAGVANAHVQTALQNRGEERLMILKLWKVIKMVLQKP